jgi:hypothetical protein
MDKGFPSSVDYILCVAAGLLEDTKKFGITKKYNFTFALKILRVIYPLDVCVGYFVCGQGI